MTQPFVQLTPHLWVVQSALYDTNSSIFISQGPKRKLIMSAVIVA